MYLASVASAEGLIYELRRTVAVDNDLHCERLARFDVGLLREIRFDRCGVSLPEALQERLAGLHLDVAAFEAALEPWAPSGWTAPADRTGTWKRTVMTRSLEDRILSLHPFDRRRMAFLRSGEVNLSRIDEVHPKMFVRMLGKCRDELEHDFLHMERELPAADVCSYVYAAFNLQRSFASPAARVMPETVDTQALDEAFLREFCALLANERLWKDAEEARIHARRYLFMHFDHGFPLTDPFRRIYEDFMNANRRPRSRPQPVPPDEVRELFGLSMQEVRAMSRRAFASVFRRKAMAMHPDKGGDHDTFVRLLDLYKRIVAGKDHPAKH